MAKGNKIIVKGGKGRIEWVIVDGTPKPGTCMTVKAATEPVNENYTYEAYNRSQDGVRAPVAVLLEQEGVGRLPTTAYASGELARVYFPLPGDELNVLVANIAGTGDAFAIGDPMMIDDGTGKLVVPSSEEAEPFIIYETVAALTADALTRCMFTGS